jgi:hypothetical protein
VSRSLSLCPVISMERRKLSSDDERGLTDPGYASGHGCRGDRGRSHGRGPGRGHGGRPCGASRDGGGSASDGGEESDEAHDLYRCGRIATKRTEACGPTGKKVNTNRAFVRGTKVASLTSIFKMSSRPIRLLCISWYASSASRRSSYSTNANLDGWVRHWYCLKKAQ